MLQNLRIKNFKIFEDTGPIKLAPITLFFGANNSGKSSVGQFLLLLKQSAAHHDRNKVLCLGNDNSPVRFSSYQDLVFQHDIERAISFEHQWDIEKVLCVADLNTVTFYTSDNLSFGCQVAVQSDCDSLASNEIILDRLEYKMRYRNIDGEPEDLTAGMRREPDTGEYDLVSNKYQFVRGDTRQWLTPKARHYYGFSDETL
jgi:hypothetical protein